MELKYYITTLNGNVIASNITEEFLKATTFPNDKIELSTCPITRYPIRHGYFTYQIASVYLVSYDKDITNKIFKRYFDACLFFIPNLTEAEKEFKKKESQNFRRLRHNLITHNTSILQDIENTFYTDGTLKGAQKQINFIKDIIQKSPEQVALTILKIIKSANLMKTDFDVFDMVNSDNPYIELDRHNIHKVLVSVLKPFWIDLFEKGVIIQVDDCSEYVNIDYKSISVVFTHLFDNAVKYVAPNTIFNIKFASSRETVSIILEMTSLKITKNDLARIYEENFSGDLAQKIGKSGDGIGMFMVKKLIELNKGKIEVKPNVNSESNLTAMGVPFERNQFIVELKK